MTITPARIALACTVIALLRLINRAWSDFSPEAAHMVEVGALLGALAIGLGVMDLMRVPERKQD